MAHPRMRGTAVLLSGLILTGVGSAPVLLAADGAPAAAQGRGRGHSKRTNGKTVEWREVTLPAGTTLQLSLVSPIGSETSRVEDSVRATLRNGVAIDRLVVLPSGTDIVGYVTEVERSGRVKGRARLAVRFTTLEYDGDRYDVRTDMVQFVADGTKAKDAATIGVGAGAGAAIGAILGGGSGAVKGAAIGGAAGTGTVLATRGEEVELASGEPLDTRLTAPLRVRIPVR